MAIDPPYRFDPFQNLVNVCWGYPYVFVVKEYWESYGPPVNGSCLIHSSSDGVNWSTFDPNTLGISPAGNNIIDYKNGMFVFDSMFYIADINGFRDKVFASTDFFNWTNIWNGADMPPGTPTIDEDYLLRVSYSDNIFGLIHGNVDIETTTNIINPVPRNALKYSGIGRLPNGIIAWYCAADPSDTYPPGTGTGTFGDIGFFIYKDNGFGPVWTQTIFPQKAHSLGIFLQSYFGARALVAGGTYDLPLAPS